MGYMMLKRLARGNDRYWYTLNDDFSYDKTVKDGSKW